MRIPFALHRRIPQVRRVLERRDQLMRDLEAARAQIAVLNAQLGETLDAARAGRDAAEKRERSLATEVAVRNAWVAQVEADLRRVQGALQQAQKEFLRRPVHSTETMLLFHDGSHARAAAQELHGLLRPMRAMTTPLVRLGRPNDGGYVMLDRGLDGVPAYSLGVGDDVSWDLAMAERGCDVWLYDHTITALPETHPALHWERVGIAAESAGDMRSLADLITANGHQDRTDLILKMDIEGAEWEVLEVAASETLAQFSQIVMEVHGMAPDINEGHERRAAVLRRLNETHQLFHVHGNNWGSLAIVGGIPIVDVMELCYARRGDYSFTPTTQVFPTPLDQPCHPERPDYFLGAMGAF